MKGPTEINSGRQEDTEWKFNVGQRFAGIVPFASVVQQRQFLFWTYCPTASTFLPPSVLSVEIFISAIARSLTFGICLILYRHILCNPIFQFCKAGKHRCIIISVPEITNQSETQSYSIAGIDMVSSRNP